MNDFAVIGKPYQVRYIFKLIQLGQNQYLKQTKIILLQKGGAGPSPSPSEGLSNAKPIQGDRRPYVSPPVIAGRNQQEKKKNSEESVRFEFVIRTILLKMVFMMLQTF